MKCLAIVQWLVEDQNCYYDRQKVFIYLRNEPVRQNQISPQWPENLTAGSVFICRAQVKPIENKTGSGFDFKEYCRLRHIYGQVFLNPDDYELLETEKGNPFFSLLDTLRRRLLRNIKKHIPDQSESGFMEALLLGFTDDLDPDLLNFYANTGVIHIIAISGLHLALICHMLQFVLGSLIKKRGRWIKLCLVISLLWSYSVLAGASPSVIRAAAMFSLVLYGKAVRREPVIFNMLAASALLLLCFDPFWLWDIGFQLSYAAVLSLLLFAGPINRLITFQNKLLSILWSATSVSIAAQILTTPVSIFYFHRFPLYFLAANLLAVPLSSLLLTGGILLCICASVPLVSDWLGLILGYTIRFLNSYIRSVAGWPGAVITDLTLTKFQTVCIYLVLFCFYRVIARREKSWFFAGLLTIFLLGLSRWFN